VIEVLSKVVSLCVDVEIAKSEGRVAMVEKVVLEVADVNDAKVEFADVEEAAQELRSHRGTIWWGCKDASWMKMMTQLRHCEGER
jgi:hypothetical protein